MAQLSSSFPCPRCGQERVVLKKWTEESDNPLSSQPTKHTLMVCPDEQCQAKQNASLAVQEEKRQALILAKQERQQAQVRTPASQPVAPVSDQPVQD